VSASVFFGIGSYFQAAGWAQATEWENAFGSGLSYSGYAAKTLSHGVAGGVMAEMQGGRFGHGFASAGFSEAMSPALGHIRSVPAQAITAAVIGGTASKLAGGKFANGAVTAAFGFAFGRMAVNSELEVRKSGRSASLSAPDDPYMDLSPMIKASAALDVVRETCPANYACDVPRGFTIKDLRGDSAATNIVTGEVSFNVRFFDFSVDYNASSVLDSAYHESMHRGSGFFGMLIDANAENKLGYITDRHQQIYDRSSEMTIKNIGKYYEQLQIYRDAGMHMVPSGR
jgi:hypothetical protein